MKHKGAIMVVLMFQILSHTFGVIPKHSEIYYEATKPEVHKAMRYGAKARIVYRVIDDEGNPITNTVVNGTWQNDYPRKTWQRKYKTDEKGCFIAEDKVGHGFACRIQKDGYYNSYHVVTFDWRAGVSPLIKDGKWQPYGENRKIVLKRKKNPIEMAYYRWGIDGCLAPATNEWIGLDLEKGKWCKPYGEGKYADVKVRFSGVVFDRYGRDTTAEFSFADVPFAGFYIEKKDSYSTFDTCYVALTNDAAYTESSFLFRNKTTLHMPQDQKVFRYLDKGEYMVFRTRCKVDEEGKLVSAHYGKISGAFYGGMMRLMFRGNDSGLYFNPTPNDTNLEHKR